MKDEIMRGSSLHLFLHSAVQIHEIHIFIISSFIFPGYITDQFNDQLPVGLLAQLVRALYRYREDPARIFFTFISSFRSSNIWNSYIHNFILHLSRVYYGPI